MNLLSDIASPETEADFGPPNLRAVTVDPARVLRRVVLALLAVAFVAVTSVLVYLRSHAQGEANLKAATNDRLDLFAAVVEARVRRLEPVPATIQLNPIVLEELRSPNPWRAREANDYLARLNAHLGSAAVYVLNERGVVLASSNLIDLDDSLLGEDVSYRPYYQEALAGRAARHFAIGSGGQAGYFVSQPIFDGSRVVGVAAIKIGLDGMNQSWSMLAAPALVADANQVVILSSKTDWLYTSLTPLSADRRVDLHLAQTYGSLRLPMFPIQVDLAVNEDTQEVTGFVSGQDSRHRSALGVGRDRSGHLVLGRSLDGMDWRVLIFASLAAVRHQAVIDGLGGGVTAAFVVLLVLFWNQRRRIGRQKQAAKLALEQANIELERQVGLRTVELTDANIQLRREVNEREQAEATLRAAQNELVHAGKMAVLGQMAASITHELTQPLGGIRTLSGNAGEFMRRGNTQAAQDNLAIVARLVDQMGRIIEPFKSFARKSSASPGFTDVGRAVEQALFLFQLRVKQEKVTVENQCEPGHWTAWCDANRLEQVLVNLFSNALDAMRDVQHRHLRIAVEERMSGSRSVILLKVCDTGKGLSDTDLQRLFEPFYTTKPKGVGLGLGLAICRDLVAEFGGDLRAGNQAEGGACFELSLPCETPDANATP